MLLLLLAIDADDDANALQLYVLVTIERVFENERRRVAIGDLMMGRFPGVFGLLCRYGDDLRGARTGGGWGNGIDFQVGGGGMYIVVENDTLIVLVARGAIL